MLSRRSSARLAVLALAAVSACQSRPVSVVTPEIEPDVADLAPLSVTGDTSWRISANADLRMHTISMPGPSTTPAIARATVPAIAKPAPSAPAAAGFAGISPESVNADPSADLLAADEGAGVLRAQVLLDRAHFSSGVINGKVGQNLEKAVAGSTDRRNAFGQLLRWCHES